MDSGAQKATCGLSLVPQLKREHIILTPYGKMRVDLAVQVIIVHCTIHFYSNNVNVIMH